MIPIHPITNLYWSKQKWEAVFAVDVIKTDSKRPDRGIVGGCLDKGQNLDASGYLLFLGKVALSILTVFSLLNVGSAAAEGLKVPLKSIAQITIDEEGHDLRFPTSVCFDPVEEEIYVSNTGSDRVVVYGPDLFPRLSIARGRGIATPRGIAVMKNGEVYVCQPHNRNNPRTRITVLNAAFFVKRDIFLDNIPEAKGIIPNQVAVNADGIIYVAGVSSRGVLVLDNEGNFLRWLKPMDKVLTRVSVEKSDEEEKQPEEEDASLADIPEEFRPQKSSGSRGGSFLQENHAPVKINDVTIDSTGKLYLLSIETSHIYVYGPDEKFLFSFGEKGGTPRHLSQPKSLAIDEKHGIIYVSDYMRQCILVYDMTGKYLFEFGGRGFGPGWFNYPMGLAINKSGQLIVADLFNNRVQVLDVGYEEISPLLKKESSSENLPAAAASESGKSAEQDEQAPVQPEGLAEQVEQPAQPSDQVKPEGDLEAEQPAQPSDQVKPEGDSEAEQPDNSE
jgi:DNA-binding beta-propeller fold protein YncE